MPKSEKGKSQKPTGKTGPIAFGNTGAVRKLVEFPATKEAIEDFIARLFCAGKSGMNPQIKRYGSFSDLEQQQENSLDFRVKTELGMRWIELVEFAPLGHFGGKYENVSGTWSGDALTTLAMNVIQNKAKKHYGSDVILVIYKTHETLFIPPPVVRTVCRDLHKSPPPFESIYYLSPHDAECASAWEIWPGNPNDDWPGALGTKIHVGFGNVGGPQ